MADHECYKPFIAYPEMAINMEMIINQFGSEIDSSLLLKNFNTSNTDYSVGNFLGCKNQHVLDHHDHDHHQNPTNLSDQDPPATSHSKHQLMIMNDFNESKKRKVNMEDVLSIADSNNGLEDKEKGLKKNSLVKGNNYRSKKSNKKQEKEEEVIHVRARRGQATDSHSLAERVRREKINNKMRYLQDLVPGCSETMGMTMMLDEIISYVHSLQNQIEFLSMELAAACSYQSNTNIKATKNSETFSQDPQEMEKLRAQLLPFNMV